MYVKKFVLYLPQSPNAITKYINIVLMNISEIFFNYNMNNIVTFCSLQWSIDLHIHRWKYKEATTSLSVGSLSESSLSDEEEEISPRTKSQQVLYQSLFVFFKLYPKVTSNGFKDFCISDIRLAKIGRKEIEIVEKG